MITPTNFPFIKKLNGSRYPNKVDIISAIKKGYFPPIITNE